MLAPIVIFAYNRPDALLRLKTCLENNKLYHSSVCHIFIDGARNDKDEELINKVSEIAQSMTRNVHISSYNKGLAISIISGVSEIINQYGKAIILEDDLICTSNFLDFMNQGLDYYQNDDNIISVCGYGLKIRKPKDYIGDVYLSNRSSSWGWGTWADRWNSIDWEIQDWGDFRKDTKRQHAFNQGGSDMTSMLKGYMSGKNNSWAIRFCYNQFRQHKYAVCPFLSKTDNIGFGDSATNCKQKYSRFKVEMDHGDSTNFLFPDKLEFNDNIARQLRHYHSIIIRMYSKLRKLLKL